MAYFPFFVEIENQCCLIVGAGIVALRKLEILKEYGPKFHVVAPVVTEEIVELAKQHPDKIRISQRNYEREDLNQADFVIAASSDDELNHQIFLSCKERKIPVNVVDVKQDCSFIMPAIIHNSSFDIAVSSGGRSPAAASYLKRKIHESIPEHYGNLVEELGEYRDYVKSKIASQKVRGEVFQHLLEAGLENECHLTSEMVEKIVKSYLTEN